MGGGSGSRVKHLTILTTVENVSDDGIDIFDENCGFSSYDDLIGNEIMLKLNMFYILVH